MQSIEKPVALRERPEVEVEDRHLEMKNGKVLVSEKPKASEEIMIEEINIDGMCGVY